MDSYYDNFLMALEKRYPNKTTLVNALADLLHLEKESVYRRLRKTVSFSVEELMCIAKAWNISLDNIIATNPQKTSSFHLKMVEFVDPKEEDYAILEQYNRNLSVIAADPNASMIEIVNTLPRALFLRSEALTRFFNMKWRHKFSPGRALTFSEIQIPERLRMLDLKYVEVVHRFSELHSIHDPHIVENLVNEIIYYRSINMLTDEDMLLLRNELLSLVDYVATVTRNGYFSGTKNRLFLYLSHTWIETEYQLFRSTYSYLTFVKVLERNTIVSPDKCVFERFMRLLLATKRMSVLVSESNALQQADFFTRQRNVIMWL